ncbi:hypothetical protein MRX96_013931 [Rhipicephalus microplus]
MHTLPPGISLPGSLSSRDAARASQRADSVAPFAWSAQVTRPPPCAAEKRQSKQGLSAPKQIKKPPFAGGERVLMESRVGRKAADVPSHLDDVSSPALRAPCPRSTPRLASTLKQN